LCAADLDSFVIEPDSALDFIAVLSEWIRRRRGLGDALNDARD